MQGQSERVREEVKQRNGVVNRPPDSAFLISVSCPNIDCRCGGGLPGPVTPLGRIQHGSSAVIANAFHTACVPTKYTSIVI